MGQALKGNFLRERGLGRDLRNNETPSSFVNICEKVLCIAWSSDVLSFATKTEEGRQKFFLVNILADFLTHTKSAESYSLWEIKRQENTLFDSQQKKVWYKE